MDYEDVIRLAVRVTLATVGVTVALIVFLCLCAAIVSPSINIPGVDGVFESPSGD